MAVWCRHGLIAQALLGASVVVVVVRGLFVCCVALVPASQVFCHQSLLDVLADVLVAARHRAVPGWPQRGVRILRHAVYLVVTVVTVHIMAVIRCWCRVVGWINIIVSLHLIVIHVDSIRVRLWLYVAGVACDIVGCRCWTGPRLVGVAAGVWLSQVGHAACVGVRVFSVAAARPASVCVVARDAVLHTRLAGVGGAIIEDLSAVAASGWGEGERWDRKFILCQELGLGLQTTAALAEMLWSVL